MNLKERKATPSGTRMTWSCCIFVSGGQATYFIWNLIILHFLIFSLPSQLLISIYCDIPIRKVVYKVLWQRQHWIKHDKEMSILFGKVCLLWLFLNPLMSKWPSRSGNDVQLMSLFFVTFKRDTKTLCGQEWTFPNTFLCKIVILRILSISHYITKDWLQMYPWHKPSWFYSERQ